MAFLGAVLVRLGFTDLYLRYVTEWMKWPLVVTGAALIVLGITQIASPLHEGDSEHGVPGLTWLLVLPGVVMFVLSPPELGSFIAERRAGEVVAAPHPDDLASLDSAGTAPMDLLEFVWRAQDGGDTLVGQSVAVDGFVSYDESGGWYLTQMMISCCAADAVAYQVRVDGAGPPPRDQWVRVTGVHVAGTGVGASAVPAITATSVVEIDPPKQTYG